MECMDCAPNIPFPPFYLPTVRLHTSDNDGVDYPGKSFFLWRIHKLLDMFYNVGRSGKHHVTFLSFRHRLNGSKGLRGFPPVCQNENHRGICGPTEGIPLVHSQNFLDLYAHCWKFMRTYAMICWSDFRGNLGKRLQVHATNTFQRKCHAYVILSKSLGM